MKKYALAVDFGGTITKIGLFCEGKLLHFETFPSQTTEPFQKVLEEMKRQFQALLQKEGSDWSQCIGLGISLPGIVDNKRRRLISVNKKYSSAVEFDIEGWVTEHLGLAVIVENDANAALMGEYATGTTKGADYAALFILGTGVGTAAMLEGKLIRGAHHQAGCLGGHLIIDYKGRACNCGSIGCLEAQASTWALPEIAKNDRDFYMSSLAEVKELKIRQLVEHARLGDGFSKKLLNAFIERWSAGIINLVHAYDPEVVVLSGGVMKAGDILTKPLIERVQKFAWTPYGTVNIVISENPEQSGLYGLDHLIKQAVTLNQ
ncbi:MAG: ROK family protein [Vallitaleaceae bacterium]|nr:ROK family protein [Vallitaleaceae bacterium]